MESQPKKPKRSLLAKLGWLYLFFTVLSVSLFSWIIRDNQLALIAENTRFQAKGQIDEVVAVLRKVASGEPDSTLRAQRVQQELTALLGALQKPYSIFNGPEVMARSEGVVLPPQALAQAEKAPAYCKHSGSDYLLEQSEDRQHLLFYIPLQNYGLTRATLLVWVSLEHVGQRMQVMNRIIWITGALLTILHLFFAFLIYRVMVAPLRRLYRATQVLDADTLHKRIQVEGDDEIASLARGFNEMTIRLEDAFQEERRQQEELRKAKEHIEQMAITDELTGLFNRRHFFEVMERDMLVAVRYGKPLSLVILDVDHFKKVNDTYGHVNGDLVLKVVARTLRETSRNTDVVARYGGEEMVLLLPETNLDQAQHAADKIRLALAAQGIPLEGHAPLRVTASFGVAELSVVNKEHPKFPATAQQFIEAADQALYRAKHGGRNRVECYAP